MEYTFEVWSKKQADKYYDGLISNCEKIAENPDLGKKYKGILKQLLEIKSAYSILQDFRQKLCSDNKNITGKNRFKKKELLKKNCVEHRI